MALLGGLVPFAGIVMKAAQWAALQRAGWRCQLCGCAGILEVYRAGEENRRRMVCPGEPVRVGYALYTHAGDEAPGQNRGQATYAFATLDGSREELERAVRLAGIGRTYGGAGVYWNVAKP